ncbi:MAG: nucleotidyltransferase family protein [Lewinellaceae bacterium]|nr:nucleotidyltransferase family protein [Lewinellaceae bacterium]
MLKNTTKTGFILLAAGASTRMGQPKQLLRYQGESLLQRTLRIARETPFRPIAIVLGARAGEMEAELESPEALVVHNSAWATGMGSSVATGLEALLRAEPELDAACFVLVDQPYLTAAHLLELHRQMEQHPEKWGAASAYDNTLGVPAIFRKALFPELLQLHGQKGAKPVIGKYMDQLIAVPFPQGQVDLDTPEDWREFLRNGN